LKEIKEALNKYKNSPCSWIRRFSIAKMLCKLVYQVSANPNQCPDGFFTEIDKPVLKFIKFIREG
jgi:hypothetical protein